jgi:hypothetical protein
VAKMDLIHRYKQSSLPSQPQFKRILNKLEQGVVEYKFFVEFTFEIGGHKYHFYAAGSDFCKTFSRLFTRIN